MGKNLTNEYWKNLSIKRESEAFNAFRKVLKLNKLANKAEEIASKTPEALDAKKARDVAKKAFERYEELIRLERYALRMWRDTLDD